MRFFIIFFIVTLNFSAFAQKAPKQSILSLIEMGQFNGIKSFYDKSYYLMNEQEQTEFLKRHRMNHPEVNEKFFYEYNYNTKGYTYSVIYAHQQSKCFLVVQQTSRLEYANECRMETSRCTRSSETNTMKCFEKYAEGACKKFSSTPDPEVHDIEKKYCEKVYKEIIGE